MQPETPETITANLATIQSTIIGFDFTTLSSVGQREAYNSLRQLGALIMLDPNTITNLPDAITAIQNAQMALKTTTPAK